MRQAALLLLLIVTCGTVQAQSDALAVGTSAPDFALADLAGQYSKLSRGYGCQVTVIGLSRLDSVPCRAMMQDLQKLQQRYRGDRVGIYVVSLEGSGVRELALKAVKQLGLTYPILTDDGDSLAQPYRAKLVPHVLVVDQDGVIRLSEGRYTLASSAKLTAAVEQYRPAKLPRLLDIEGLGCTTCKIMPPLLRAVQEELAGKVRIDVRDFDPDLVDEYALETMPTQLFLNADGKEVYRHGGPMTRDEILAQFAKMGVAVK